MPARFIVKRSGVESGPYSQEEILKRLEDGNLSSSDSVCFARKWRWLSQDVWFPAEWLRHPPSFRDMMVPRSTAIVWLCIAALGLAQVVIYLLRK